MNAGGQRRLDVRSLLIILSCSGLATSLQARVNGELALHAGSAVKAALLSFLIGLAVLTLIVGLVPAARQGVRRVPRAVRDGHLPWWATLGGLLGGVFVVCQSFAVARSGVALFAVAVVAGQTVSSLVVDKVGLGPLGKVAVTPRRFLAALLAIAGVLLATSGRFGWLAFSTAAIGVGIMAGGLTSIQQALNGRMNVAASQPVSTTWWNFVCGTAGLGVAIMLRPGLGASTTLATDSGPWWMYLGGAFGVVFIMTAAWAVPRYGVLVFALTSIAGQLASALLIDLFFPVGAGSYQLTLVFGVLLAFVAVVTAAKGRLS